MSLPESFKAGKDYATYRPSGVVSFATAIELITTSICSSSELRIDRLLVDATALKVLDEPTLFDRYHMVQRFAAVASPHLRLVVVAEPRLIDREKFGVLAAANMGLTANVFPAEPEALDWLLKR